MKIYSDVESEINQVKRGPKPKISPKDSLFLTLEMLSNMFSVKTFLLEKNNLGKIRTYSAYFSSKIYLEYSKR